MLTFPVALINNAQRPFGLELLDLADVPSVTKFPDYMVFGSNEKARMALESGTVHYYFGHAGEHTLAEHILADKGGDQSPITIPNSIDLVLHQAITYISKLAVHGIIDDKDWESILIGRMREAGFKCPHPDGWSAFYFVVAKHQWREPVEGWRATIQAGDVDHEYSSKVVTEKYDTLNACTLSANPTALDYIPTIDAIIHGDSLTFWCPHCHASHTHSLTVGWGPKPGHRAAHCTLNTSPFIARGYFLNARIARKGTTGEPQSLRLREGNSSSLTWRNACVENNVPFVVISEHGEFADITADLSVFDERHEAAIDAHRAEITAASLALFGRYRGPGSKSWISVDGQKIAFKAIPSGAAVACADDLYSLLEAKVALA